MFRLHNWVFFLFHRQNQKWPWLCARKMTPNQTNAAESMAFFRSLWFAERLKLVRYCFCCTSEWIRAGSSYRSLARSLACLIFRLHFFPSSQRKDSHALDKLLFSNLISSCVYAHRAALLLLNYYQIFYLFLFFKIILKNIS